MEEHSTLRTKLPSTALVDQDTQDHWLDRVSEHRAQRRNRWHQIWYDSIKYPRAWSIKLWRYLTTTPGKMTSIVVLLSILMLVSGLTISQASAQRRAELNTLMNSTEPVSYLAHTLYSELSIANTMATLDFVNSDANSQSARELYNQALQNAGAAVARTAVGMNNDEGHPVELVSSISQKLPVFAGLIETARANARQGNPVGVAYLSEASTLMREQILPAGSELYTITGQVVTEEQRRASRPLLWPLAGLAVTLAALLLAQVWLARTTRRRLNVGFLLATVFMTLATLWAGGASIIIWQAGVRGHEQAIAPMESLTDARILAQQARSAETLALVRRQSLDTSEQSFASAVRHVHAALDEASTKGDTETIDTAREATDQWAQDHANIAAAISVGDFDSAWKVAAQEDSGVGFDQLDRSMASLISETRSTTRSFIERGISASSWLNVGMLVLSGLALISIWIGIRPRLQEYL
ncbi:phenol hydroxylase [Corynebacterium gerontici]|uniref:Four helix bundle sensory module for signal transduction n=1 Tax=Corynebacterium gerontici TaxID=2079234 RepID=A0A3G6J0Y6_9CORY|nr:phenol hydroxylase [Corynebacterium gerontici]AZA10628.1 hypothetical protein CGERO_01470 [Corynebacterium gerontici]